MLYERRRAGPARWSNGKEKRDMRSVTKTNVASALVAALDGRHVWGWGYTDDWADLGWGWVTNGWFC